MIRSAHTFPTSDSIPKHTAGALEALRRGGAHADAEVTRETALTMETLSDHETYA
jgi:hypothetical protein